jgi:CRP-like cAMP-binding protein
VAFSLEIFRDLPVQAVSADEIVIDQGTRTGRLFTLISGKVEIVKGGKSGRDQRTAGR